MENEQKIPEKVAAHENTLHVLSSSVQPRRIRKRSDRTVFGKPFYDIAFGPDLEKGEIRGHARGFIAIGFIAHGRIASGFIAFGGLSLGVISIGGCAVGVFSIGGLTLALAIAFGGFAIAPIAVGGVAIGIVASGGLAIGYLVTGGFPIGIHIVNLEVQDPMALTFFKKWMPWALSR